MSVFGRWKDLRRQVSVNAAVALPPTHRLLKRMFPEALWDGDPTQPEIALTFDDGPHPRDTLPLLDALARHAVPATFFHLGIEAERRPGLVRAVAEAGHAIGLHGYQHRPFPIEQPLALRQQLAKTRKVICHASGCEPEQVRDVRPPYGTFLPTTLHTLIEWGYRPVMWTVVPIHWTQKADVSIKQVCDQTRPGAIIVLHESLPGPSVVDLVDVMIPCLKEKGYQFITVEQMWAQR